MSQNARILEMLKRGSVTAMDALRECQSFRIAARINDPRQAGYEIETKTIELANGKHVAQYHLKEKETATC